MIIRQIIPLRRLLLIMMLISTASGWAVTKTKIFNFGNGTLNGVAVADSTGPTGRKMKVVTVDDFRFVFGTSDSRGISFTEVYDTIYRIQSTTGSTYDVPFTVTAPEAVTMTHIATYNYIKSSDAYDVNVQRDLPNGDKKVTVTSRRSYARIVITYNEAVLSTPSFA